MNAGLGLRRSETMDNPPVKFSDFQKLDIAIVRIISVESIEKSTRMLKLKVFTGEEERVVVAGLGGQYDPDELVGQKVVMLMNIEPRRILGIESRGMILAAEDGAIVSLLKPDKDVSEGSKIG